MIFSRRVSEFLLGLACQPFFPTGIKPPSMSLTEGRPATDVRSVQSSSVVRVSGLSARIVGWVLTDGSTTRPRSERGANSVEAEAAAAQTQSAPISSGVNALLTCTALNCPLAAVDISANA